MKKINKEYWFVVLSGILFGSIVFGGKILANLGLSLYEISVLPFAFATIILFWFVIFKKECHFRKEMLMILFLYGFATLFVTVCQFGAVILGASVAITVLLLYTQPLWTIIFSTIFLKEKATLRNIVSCIIVLVGIVILVSPFPTEATSSRIGLLIALIGGISLSGWVVLGSKLSKKGNHPINTFFSGNLFMIAILLLFYPLMASLIKDKSLIGFSLNFSPIIWFYIILYGLLTVLVAHLFYLYGVKKIPTIDAGIILLLEPIVGSLLAVIFLHQPITPNIFIGGFLILSANYLVLTKKTS